MWFIWIQSSPSWKKKKEEKKTPTHVVYFINLFFFLNKRNCSGNITGRLNRTQAESRISIVWEYYPIIVQCGAFEAHFYAFYCEIADSLLRRKCRKKCQGCNQTWIAHKLVKKYAKHAALKDALRQHLCPQQTARNAGGLSAGELQSSPKFREEAKRNKAVHNIFTQLRRGNKRHPLSKWIGEVRLGWRRRGTITWTNMPVS